MRKRSKIAALLLVLCLFTSCNNAPQPAVVPDVTEADVAVAVSALTEQGFVPIVKEIAEATTTTPLSTTSEPQDSTSATLPSTSLHLTTTTDTLISTTVHLCATEHTYVLDETCRRITLPVTLRTANGGNVRRIQFAIPLP